METTRPQSRKSLWVSGGWYLLAALPVGLGILTGVLSILAAMMAVLTLASLVWLHTAGSPVRLLCLCGGSVWGGISGVNAPHRKPPR